MEQAQTARKITLIAVFAIISMFLINTASALNIGSVSTSPSEVAPGQSVTLAIELENNLDDDIQDADISLNLANLPISPERSSEVFIDEINEDDSEEAVFDLIVDADAEAGVYKIPLTISYKLGNVTLTKTSLVSITVSAKPFLSLNTEGTLLKSQKNTLQIQITNTGLAKSKFLQARLEPSTAYDILSSDTIYIGDLNSDDFDTLTFEVYIKDSSLVTFPITLIYKDVSNQDYNELSAVSARAYSQEEALNLGLIKKSNTLLYIGILVLIIVAWFVYRAIRKRRRAKKNGIKTQ